MKFAATITRILQPGIHKIGGLKDGEISAREFPRPNRVEIDCEGGDGPCFLIRYTSDGRYCGDTWHETFSDALDQARFEYGLSEEDFVAVNTSAWSRNRGNHVPRWLNLDGSLGL